jgi:hypothetical protein
VPAVQQQRNRHRISHSTVTHSNVKCQATAASLTPHWQIRYTSN